jgi:23S rRNA-/tRNA-specific pseudouridylate synthase
VAAREKLWVVRPADGTTLGEVLARAKEGAIAIEEGRVFIGKKRATHADQAVKPGDAIRIGPGRKEEPATAPIEVLFEEDGLVACVKPAGLPTVPDHAGSSHSLVATVARQLGRLTDELRVTSRLDREVSGVVIFALGAGAEERLRSARAEGRYKRRYVALAAMTRSLLEEEGVWRAPIGRASDPRLRAARGPDAKSATTRWRRIAVASEAATPTSAPAAAAHGIAMLAVDPVSGRTHQIRVHAADAGAPLIGDRDYGGPGRLVLRSGRILAPARIALHAAQVTVPGPHGPLVARAKIPAALEELWSALGGDASAWERAVWSETPPDSGDPDADG